MLTFSLFYFLFFVLAPPSAHVPQVHQDRPPRCQGRLHRRTRRGPSRPFFLPFPLPLTLFFPQNPSYREVCTGSTAHAEALKITFDPSQVSYAELTEFHFRMHNPSSFPPAQLLSHRSHLVANPLTLPRQLN